MLFIYLISSFTLSHLVYSTGIVPISELLHGPNGNPTCQSDDADLEEKLAIECGDLKDVTGEVYAAHVHDERPDDRDDHFPANHCDLLNDVQKLNDD